MHRGLRSRPVQHGDLRDDGARERRERLYQRRARRGARRRAHCAASPRDIVSVLAPICPFACEELWHAALGREGASTPRPWPEFDAAEAAAG
ncbi:MAG: class I tRNA ligase family protein [Collinsella sp.]